MKTNLNKLFHGAIAFHKKNGYIIPRRFTDSQVASFDDSEFFHSRIRCGASITLELVTAATLITFDYKFFLRTGVESAFEVYVNGFLMHLVYDENIKDEDTIAFAFEKGEKYIEIYIPNYSEIGIKNFSVNGEYKPVKKRRTKVLFIGDSITQGGGSKRSGQTYVNVVKRALNYEILNQGIGGYYCDKNIVQDLPVSPSKIIVAFGTNHRIFPETENEERVEAFFKALNGKYNNLKTIVILPPYYGREQTDEIRDRFKKVKKIFVNVVSKYPNMKIVSAYDMIPHCIEYYLDDFVHPNALGMEVYGNNLVKAIKEIKF